MPSGGADAAGSAPRGLLPSAPATAAPSFYGEPFAPRPAGGETTAPSVLPPRADVAALPALRGVGGSGTGELGVLHLRVVRGRGETGLLESRKFQPRAGLVLAGRYRVVRSLGSGAFSEAVEAHDLQNGRAVCLKSKRRRCWWLHLQFLSTSMGLGILP